LVTSFDKMDAKEWQRTVNGEMFLISTAKRILPVEFVQEVFDNPAVFWTKRSSAADTETLLDNSCSLGLFKVQNGTKFPIGMARIVTDYVTLAYLTDVFVLDEFRTLGLGKWLIRCCRDIMNDIPDLRWSLLMTGNEQAQRFYRRELGMELLGSHANETVAAMGARKAHIASASAAES
jgi:ribosomal protein S18 acetylase RimI-like enzyme